MVQGKIRNPGLLCKKARKLGIVNPRGWSLEDILQGRAISKSWKHQLQLSANSLRTEHLQLRLLAAEADDDKDRASAVRAMIKREEDSTMWRELQFASKDNGGRSNAVTRVERVENGRIVEYIQQ